MSKLGIIAGEGKFPILIAKEAQTKGLEVFVICVKGNAKEEDFAPYAKKSVTLKIGQLSKALNFLKENAVTKAVMAGRVEHFNIFNLIPDFRTAKVLATLKDMRAKSILEAAINEFKKEGIEIQSSAMFLEKFIPPKSILTKRKPTEEEEKNIELGQKISKTLATLDVGLTSVICDKAVVAVEGMEGTDNCILRAGQIVAQNPGKNKFLVVVKVARPKQDDRYDLPIIGKGTIKSMIEAKANVLAVEAGKTIILDIDEVCALADKNDISIIAF